MKEHDYVGDILQMSMETLKLIELIISGASWCHLFVITGYSSCGPRCHVALDETICLPNHIDDAVLGFHVSGCTRGTRLEGWKTACSLLETNVANSHAQSKTNLDRC